MQIFSVSKVSGDSDCDCNANSRTENEVVKFLYVNLTELQTVKNSVVGLFAENDKQWITYCTMVTNANC